MTCYEDLHHLKHSHCLDLITKKTVGRQDIQTCPLFYVVSYPDIPADLSVCVSGDHNKDPAKAGKEYSSLCK